MCKQVCNEGKRKTSRVLWNWEEGMFLSGSEARPWDLILGTPDLTRRLQWLQRLPGKAVLISYHEGKHGPHPKMLIHEPKATGFWSPAQSILWVPLVELLKTEHSGFGWIPFEKSRMSKDCLKKHPTGIKKAVKKDPSEQRSLCNRSTDSQKE